MHFVSLFTCRARIPNTYISNAADELLSMSACCVVHYGYLSTSQQWQIAKANSLADNALACVILAAPLLPQQSITTFAESMQKVDGNRVGFCATPNAPHDVITCHPSVDMTEELLAVLDEAHAFLEGRK